MMKSLFLAGGIALAALSAPATSQDMASGSMSGPGSMTAQQVGASPMTGTSDADYVRMAADSDMYEMTSSKLALSRSKRADVKAFANEMIRDHTTTTKTLLAALKNDDRKIAPPSKMMSADNKAKVDMLKKAPKASFDNMYLSQQMAGHQMAWSLHKGYATDGSDPALKQVANSAVPIVEHHLGELKTMTAGSPSTM